jgi:phosphoribosylamine--glycine ligase
LSTTSVKVAALEGEGELGVFGLAGAALEGSRAAAADQDHFAKTAVADGELCASGGRVLNVCALGATLQEARDLAYAAVETIDFPGGFYRTDIGWRAL